jgi:hypothetical protein
VAGVQFLVDGANYGAEATGPYAVTLKSNSLSTGTHTIAARARDSSGNLATATITIVKQ